MRIAPHERGYIALELHQRLTIEAAEEAVMGLGRERQQKKRDE
jgi:hypothetical protein